MASADLEQKIAAHIKQQPDWFENIVLGCALQDLEFYKKVQPVLCKAYWGDETVTDDFDELLRNVVYRAASDYNIAQMRGNQPFHPISVDVMAIMLRNRAIDGEDLMLDELPRAIELYMEAMQVSTASWRSWADIGITTWLEAQKTRQVIKSPYIMNTWTLSEIRDRLAQVEQQTQRLEYAAEAKRGVIGDYLTGKIKVDEDTQELLPTNLTQLNKALGGGFRRRDTALFIAPSGAGKTIFACQMAGHWSMLGKGGILVTTEQDQQELEERFVSNFAKIPFEQVVGKWNPDGLLENQRHNYETWLKGMSAPIRVVDWTVPGNTVIENLRDEVMHYKKEFGEYPTYMIFDWIGGALQDAYSGDTQKLRAVYKHAVDTIVALCRQYSMAGLVLAQAAQSKSTNRFPIGVDNIAEAKNMVERISVQIGLTALYAEGMDTETDTSNIMYADKQWLCVPKARKSPGGNVPVKRAYRYQRLEDWR